MKVLIIHAHENPDSFCSAIRDELKRVATSAGHEVKESDLYMMNFNPVASRRDFNSLSGQDYYKIQNEQKSASERNAFAEDVQLEMEKLLWADVLIFNYPLWWFSLPAILKGWVDRVMAFGFSYGAPYGVYANGRFKDKTGVCFVTTGGPEAMYTVEGAHQMSVEQMMKPIHHNIFYFNGLHPSHAFVSFAVARQTPEVRESILRNAGNHLLGVLEEADKRRLQN